MPTEVREQRVLRAEHLHGPRGHLREVVQTAGERNQARREHGAREHREIGRDGGRLCLHELPDALALVGEVGGALAERDGALLGEPLRLSVGDRSRALDAGVDVFEEAASPLDGALRDLVGGVREVRHRPHGVHELLVVGALALLDGGPRASDGRLAQQLVVLVLVAGDARLDGARRPVVGGVRPALPDGVARGFGVPDGHVREPARVGHGNRFPPRAVKPTSLGPWCLLALRDLSRSGESARA